MLIVMPLWLWLLILQLTWRVTVWSVRLTLTACRWATAKGRSK